MISIDIRVNNPRGVGHYIIKVDSFRQWSVDSWTRPMILLAKILWRVLVISTCNGLLLLTIHRRSHNNAVECRGDRWLSTRKSSLARSLNLNIEYP